MAALSKAEAGQPTGRGQPGALSEAGAGMGAEQMNTSFTGGAELVQSVESAARKPSDEANSRDVAEVEAAEHNVDNDEEATEAAHDSRSLFLEYNQRLTAAWKDMPRVDVVWKDLSYIIPVPVDETSIPNLFKWITRPFVKVYRLVNNRVDHEQNESNDSNKTTQLQRSKTLAETGNLRRMGALYHCSGRLRPGQMTMVLAPPGHGKSVLLKLLSGRITNVQYIKGKVFYNGLEADELRARSWYREKLSGYVYQTDNHLPVLTVRETMQFALDNAVADVAQLGDERLTELHRNKTEMVIKMLGLSTAADTIAGNALLRGVSGGEKKRLSIGEMLMLNCRALFLDEITNGLDASVAYDITSALKQWVHTTQGSILAAYQQPTPETFRQFDSVILLREGQIVYQGPRAEAVPYMQAIGAHKPSYMDAADWLVDFLTTPYKYAHPLPHGCCDGGEGQCGKNGRNHHDSPDSDGQSPRSIDSDDLGLNKAALGYPTWTTAGLVERYKASTCFSEIMSEEHVFKSHLPRQTSVQSDENNTTSFATATPMEPVHQSKHQQSSSVSGYTKQQYCQQYVWSVYWHSMLVLVRQFRLVTRNKTLWIPRWSVNTIMALVLGGLFFNVSFTSYQTRVGLVLFAVVTNAFSNMSELPATDEAKPVLYKQLGTSFYPAPSYILSVTICGLPVAAIGTLILGSTIYWMTGFSSEAGRFFFFLLVLYCTDFLCATAFRLISYSVRNHFIAQQIDGPCVGLFMVFGGFLITYNELPRWLIWLYWMSPFAWAVRAIAISEFNDSRYDFISPGATQRAGDLYLEGWDIQTSSSYEWAGIGYLLGIGFLCMLGGVYQISHKRFEVAIGTKRQLELEEQQEAEVIRKMDAERTGKAETYDSTVLIREQSVSDAMPFTPMTLVWRHLSYEVTLPNKKQRMLLTDISGYCKPGEMTALMGASGAGKTTLMDVITGRKTAGKMEGEVLINGAPKEESAFRKVSGYVEQQDLHMPFATIHESLLFSANLRLPSSVSTEQKANFVREIENMLELNKIANRIIGNESVGGIAPAQLKLVTMAVELCANPALMFLDEPTTGLDSRAAVIVMEGIRRISRTGRTVLCTIHQPSADVFFMMDRLLLLKTGGFTVYNGNIGKQGKDLVNYFENATENAPRLPKHVNPGSWMLDIVARNNEQIADSQERGESAMDYKTVYAQSQLAKDNEREIEQILARTDEPPPKFPHRYATNPVIQMRRVLVRQWFSYFRNVPFNGTRLAVQLFLGIMYGLVFQNTYNPTSTNPLTLNATLGGVFIQLAFSGVVNSSTALPVINAERPVFYREKASNTYSPMTYAMAIFICEIPYIIAGASLYALPFYFLVDLQKSASVFFGYWFMQILLGLTFNGVGHMLAAAMPNILAATQVQGLFFTFSFLFGGVFVHGAQLPPGWVWIYNINPVPKAVFSNIYPQYQFYDTQISVPTSQLASSITSTATGNSNVAIPTYLSNYVFNIQPDSYATQVGWIFLIMLVIRLGAVLAINFISHIKR